MLSHSTLPSSSLTHSRDASVRHASSSGPVFSDFHAVSAIIKAPLVGCCLTIVSLAAQGNTTVLLKYHCLPGEIPLLSCENMALPISDLVT